MFYLLYFQDVVGLWGKLADQGIAIAVLIVIGIFGILFLKMILPVWERIRTADAVSRKSQADAFSLMATAQDNLATVVKDIAVEQKQSTDAVKILQRVNVQANENLAFEVQTLSESTNKIVERLDLLEKR